MESERERERERGREEGGREGGGGGRGEDSEIVGAWLHGTISQRCIGTLLCMPLETGAQKLPSPC